MLRNYLFWAKFFIPLIKFLTERFLQNFRIFLENWIFDGNFDGNLTTNRVTILNCAKKLFIPLQIKGFYKILGILNCAIFGKLNFWRKFKNNESTILNCAKKLFLDLTKIVCTILNCAKKLFFCYKIYSTHQKGFYKILGNFGKLNFWLFIPLNFYRKFDRRGPYKNSENFVLS